tara:strand:+ start:2039 stop:2470 length:432 start_codon:yes stop_codon:yes gene_type:complete
MGFFTALFSIGKKIAVPLANLGRKMATPIANIGKKIGSGISSGFQRVKNIFNPQKPPTQLSEPLLGSIPNPSQIDKIVKLGQQMPVKESWMSIRESGKAIGGVSKKGVGGLTKSQRIAQRTRNIMDAGKKLNQADYVADFLSL